MDDYILLRLINTTGQVIETRKIKNAATGYSETFNVSGLSKGMYYLIIFSEKKQAGEKIIVQ